ncbi:MAG TPA: CatB-related O-acetyltransferase [Chloroflexota bacterium]|jgi:acetyltransferase-like isoleucine patch superfamily enzyme|nr:CatB-related O-acetyltransferase [Chloroflexota bacterium]
MPRPIRRFLWSTLARKYLEWTNDHLTVHAGSRVYNSDFGKHVRIHPGAIIRASSIDDYTYVGIDSIVQRSTVGKFCSIAPEVFLGLVNHPTETVSTHPAFFLRRPPDWNFVDSDHFAEEPPGVTVGNDVWIGFRASVMSGVTIGDGAVIAAGAIVTKDVSPYAIWGGVPAKFIRYRFDPSTIEALLEIKWWNWDESAIRSASAAMLDTDEFLSRCAGRSRSVAAGSGAPSTDR